MDDAGGVARAGFAARQDRVRHTHALAAQRGATPAARPFAAGAESMILQRPLAVFPRTKRTGRDEPWSGHGAVTRARVVVASHPNCLRPGRRIDDAPSTTPPRRREARPCRPASTSMLLCAACLCDCTVLYCTVLAASTAAVRGWVEPAETRLPPRSSHVHGVLTVDYSKRSTRDPTKE